MSVQTGHATTTTTMPPAEAAPRPLDALTARRMVSEGRAVLVDVRGRDEYAREHIPGARSIPLDELDPATLPAEPGQAVILQCASGQRSASACDELEGAVTVPLHELKGGLQAWKAAGLPVAVDVKAPLPIMRQVQIVAGSMVVLGVLLAWSLHPAFMLLSAFVGAGLVYAGVSGDCRMARLLARLPYNRRA